MKQLIIDVLEEISTSQINLHSATAREIVAEKIINRIRSSDKGWFLNLNRSEGKPFLYPEAEKSETQSDWVCDICGKDTSKVDYDYIGSGANHLSCELELEEDLKSRDDIKQQLYTEMTADGLPPGGDVQATLEASKLADEIVDSQKGKWIYESPDGGKTMFRRPFADYDMSKKVEIDWETKEPTGRKFTDYPYDK
jgi:hypothetical protein